MTAKIIIETLTEIPDEELLIELELILMKSPTISLADVSKLFWMFVTLFKAKQRLIVLRSLRLLTNVNTKVLPTEVQIGWQILSESVIDLLGAEDQEIRQKAKNSLIQFLTRSQNYLTILEKLYSQGLESQSPLVLTQSIKAILTVLETSEQLLVSKSLTNVLKIITEKIVRLFDSSTAHIQVKKEAQQFFQKLFYLKIQRLDQVLQRLDGYYVKVIEKIWAKSKESLIYKQSDQNAFIKYEQLPIINDKIFGIYEPFVLKNIFNIETQAAHKYAISIFKQLFFENEGPLLKYANVISKILLRLLEEDSVDAVQMLRLMLSFPGICNIVNMSCILPSLIFKLGTENISFRRQVRECFKVLNFAYRKHVLKSYSQDLSQIEKAVEHMDSWIKVVELFLLIEHWVGIADDALNCLPPVLDMFVLYASRNLDHSAVRVQEKCKIFLINIMEKYPSYRETLEENMGQENMNLLEDRLQNYKTNSFELSSTKQAKAIFLQQYKEARETFALRRQ